MNFRHPELADRQRFHSDFSEWAGTGRDRTAEELLGPLVLLALLCVAAVASLAAAGTSLVPLLALLVATALLILIGALRAG